MTEKGPNLKISDNTEQREIWGMENLNNLIDSGGGDEFDEALLDALRFGQIKKKQLLELALKLVKKNRIELNEAKKQVYLDPLTGLLDRRVFDKELSVAEKRLHQGDNKIKERRESHKGYVLCVFIDIDDFKAVNDNPKYGHSVGDQVLRALVLYLEEEANERGGKAFRWGGDEFAIIQEGKDNLTDDQVAEISQRIETKINSRLSVPVGAEQLNVTISVGAAILRQGENKTIKELEDEADRQMYNTKKRKQESK